MSRQVLNGILRAASGLTERPRRSRRNAGRRRRAHSDRRVRDGWRLPMRTAVCCVVTWVLLSAGLADAAEGQGISGQPRNLTATVHGDSAISLSWDAPTTGGAPTGYAVRLYDFATGIGRLIATTDASTRMYRHTNVTERTAYIYQVAGTNSSGEGAVALATPATPGPEGTPGAPASLTLSAVGDTAMDLSWTVPTDSGNSPVTGYRVEMWRFGSGPRTLVTTNTTGTTYRHKHDLSGVYVYWVSAINTTGAGTPRLAFVFVGTGRSDAPEDLVATANGDTAIDLSWTAPSDDGGAITGYRIFSSNTGEFETWSVLVANTDTIATTYSDTGLNGGTTRFYAVVALNSSGPGTPSNVATATTERTPGAPEMPTGLTATENYGTRRSICRGRRRRTTGAAQSPDTGSRCRPTGVGYGPT